MIRLIALFFTCFVGLMAHATEPDFFSVTGAASVAADAQGRHWAYVTWTSTQPASLSGKSFAVYAKAGLPSTPGSFVKQGVVTPIVNATLFAPLLQRAQALGDNLDVVNILMDGIVDHIDLMENTASRPSVARNLPLANKLQAVLVKASQHPSVLEGLEQLKSRHTSIALCLGRGWAGQIMSQVTTYELREFNIATGVDIGVVGRITLDWANPVALSTTGKPAQLINLRPEGDLNIRLRWSVPDALRRLGPQVQGYSVWRCSWAYAQAQGWDVNPPTQAAFVAGLVGGEVVRASAVYFRIGPNVVAFPQPVFPSEYLDQNTVENSDAGPYFFADENRRYEKLDPGAAFNDGDQFGYLITARPLIPQPGTFLAGEGPPSIAGHGIACRTMPPDVPGSLKAVSKFTHSGVVGAQHVKLTWKANQNGNTLTIPPAIVTPPALPKPATISPAAQTTHYQILRSTNTADFTSYSDPFAGFTAGPIPTAVIAEGILHGTDGETLIYEDLDVSGLAAPGQTVAYAVRAYRQSACGNIYSAPSPPVFVALKDYTGPSAPTGSVFKHCPAPFVGVPQVDVLTTAPPNGLHHFHLECTRRDEQIGSVSFVVFDHDANKFVSEEVSLAFPPHLSLVSHDFTHPHGNLTVHTYVKSKGGSISWPFSKNLTSHADETKIVKLHLLAGIVDPCGAAQDDPLARFAYGRAFKFGAGRAEDRNGNITVSMTFAGGLTLPEGAKVTVLREGSFNVLAEVLVSSNGVIFDDNSASGLTEAQLINRYRCFTNAGSVIPLENAAILNNGYAKLSIAPEDMVVEGTQICVVTAAPGAVFTTPIVPSYTLVGPAEAKSGSLIIRDSVQAPGVNYYGKLFLGPMVAGSCNHSPVAGLGSNQIKVPVTIQLQPMPSSVEYRIYRRVDEGPLSLIAQGDTELDNDALKELVRSDDSLPSVNCTLYYFGQTLDKNGNPSPLELLDTIRIGVSSVTPLPTPMILPPKYLVDGSGNASIQISWFSSTAGVDRFLIMLVADKPTPPPPGVHQVGLTQDLFDAQTGERKTFYIRDSIVTARVGTHDLGPGPAFTWTIPIATGNTYSVAVMAQGPDKVSSEGFTLQAQGEFSQAAAIIVPKTPTGSSSNPVAWPFRGLPEVISHPLVAARWLPTLTPGYVMQPFGRSSGVGVSFAAVFNDRGFLEQPEAFKAAFFLGNPNAGVFSLSGTPTTKTLPVVLYRQQVRYSSPGVERPANEQGAIVQASPQISKIAHSIVQDGVEAGRSYVNDPAIGSFYFTANKVLALYLMDKLPVTKGATYRYWLVHFNDRQEPDRVIHANTITIPTL